MGEDLTVYRRSKTLRCFSGNGTVYGHNSGESLKCILFIFVPAINTSTVGIMVPVGVIFTLVMSKLLYKLGWI